MYRIDFSPAMSSPAQESGSRTTGAFSASPAYSGLNFYEQLVIVERKRQVFITVHKGNGLEDAERFFPFCLPAIIHRDYGHGLVIPDSNIPVPCFIP